MSGWLTIEEAAQRVGKSPDTIYRWIRQGHLRAFGGKVVEAHVVVAAAQVRRGRPRKKSVVQF